MVGAEPTRNKNHKLCSQSVRYPIWIAPLNEVWKSHTYFMLCIPPLLAKLKKSKLS